MPDPTSTAPAAATNAATDALQQIPGQLERGAVDIAQLPLFEHLSAIMPAADLSRLFAERYLHQAMVEAGNGEFDECLEWVERANEEIRDRPHALRPGETLKILRPDEIPAPPK